MRRTVLGGLPPPHGEAVPRRGDGGDGPARVRGGHSRQDSGHVDHRTGANPRVPPDIDLPGSDCRMLVLYHRPMGATLLERFFLERLGATSVLRDRIRTRITQAMGRCTRDEGDFSVVVLMGEDILDWCSTTANVSGLHPEIQAEIALGLANSENRSKNEMVNLARALLDHTPEWTEDAERDIQNRRNLAHKQKESIADVLAKVAPVEISYCSDSEAAERWTLRCDSQRETGSNPHTQSQSHRRRGRAKLCWT